MAKKKNLDGQLADAQSAAASYTAPAPEEDEPKKKKMTSLYIDPDNYELLRLLASSRTMQGERNHLGQAVSAAQLVNEAIAEYLERNRPEIEMALAYQQIKDGQPLAIHAKPQSKG